MTSVLHNEEDIQEDRIFPFEGVKNDFRATLTSSSNDLSIVHALWDMDDRMTAFVFVYTDKN